MNGTKAPCRAAINLNFMTIFSNFKKQSQRFMIIFGVFFVTTFNELKVT